MRERGLGRCLAMLNVGLDDLKRTTKTTEGSLNDVFLATVISGLRRYHERHGTVIESLRMSLPINLRTTDDDSGGNRYAPTRFPVPTGIEDPTERVQAIRTLVRGWRGRSHAADVARARRHLEPAPDGDNDRALRWHVEVLRLRHDECAGRARTGLHRRRRAWTACTRSHRPRAPRSTCR